MQIFISQQDKSQNRIDCTIVFWWTIFVHGTSWIVALLCAQTPQALVRMKNLPFFERKMIENLHLTRKSIY